MRNRRKMHCLVWLLVLMLTSAVACNKKDAPENKDGTEITDVTGTPVVTATPTEKPETTPEITVTPTPDQVGQKLYVAKEIIYSMYGGEWSEASTNKYVYDSNGTPVYLITEYISGDYYRKSDAQTGTLLESRDEYEDGSTENFTYEYEYDAQGKVVCRKVTATVTIGDSVSTEVEEWEYNRTVFCQPFFAEGDDKFLDKYTKTVDGTIVEEILTEYIDGRPVKKVTRCLDGDEMVVSRGYTYSERSEEGCRVYQTIHWYVDESGEVINYHVLENWYEGDIRRQRKIEYPGTVAWEVFTYNEEGQPLEYNFCWENGWEATGYRYTYDEEGRILTAYEIEPEYGSWEREYFYHDEGVVVVTNENDQHFTIAEYDVEEDLLYEVVVDASSFDIKEVELFEEETETGTSRGTKGFDANGEEVFCYYKNWDDTGKLISESAYGIEGRCLQSTKYSYGERGELLSEVTVAYTPEETITYENSYSYNLNGDLVEKAECSYFEDGLSFGEKIVYEYAPLEELWEHENE